MMVHPITLVVNIFGTGKTQSSINMKFMCLQNHEVHTRHVKQLTSNRR